MIISNVLTDFLISKTYIRYTIKHCIAFKLMVKKSIKEPYSHCAAVQKQPHKMICIVI